MEELEWAVEVLKTSELPVCCTMSLNEQGDGDGNSVEECALGMAQCGANVIGINCNVGPFESLKIMSRIASALQEADIQRHLMMQPLGLHTPDVMNAKNGWGDLAEYPLGEMYYIRRYFCTGMSIINK